jgi:hypothetical protein
MKKTFYNDGRFSSEAVIPRISTYLFNNLQVGLVIYLIYQNKPLINALYFYLAFEFAILFDCIIKFGTLRFWGGILIFSATGMLIVTALAPPNSIIYFLCIFIFGCALSIKKIRTLTHALGKVKRHWRALGYLTGYFFSPIFLFFGSLILFIYILNHQKKEEDFTILAPITSNVTITPYLCVLFHHWHYFAYAYMILIEVHTNFRVPLIYAGAIFYIGWLGYYLFLKVNKHPKAYIVTGHIISSISVLGLIFTENLAYYLLLWFITGIGAGTIILLRDIWTTKDENMYDQFKTWESFGHLLGIVSFGIALLFHTPSVGYCVSAFAGISCAGLALLKVSTQDLSDI